MRLYNRYKNYKRSTNHNWVPPEFGFIGQIVLYLLPAMVVFIFFPAVLFTYFEGWDYTISAYYAFVTLTTIGKALIHKAFIRNVNMERVFFLLLQGFGDYVPTFQPHQEREFGIYFVFYQLFILLWFITGNRQCLVVRATLSSVKS